jgi:hypothetical protein
MPVLRRCRAVAKTGPLWVNRYILSQGVQQNQPLGRLRHEHATKIVMGYKDSTGSRGMIQSVTNTDLRPVAE